MGLGSRLSLQNAAMPAQRMLPRFRSLLHPLVAAPLLTAVALALPPQPITQAQTLPTSRREAWRVALPGPATVELRQGWSVRGQLVRFSAAELTVAAGSDRQTVPLGTVTVINFGSPEVLWLALAEGGRKQARPGRGITLPIENVPRSALHLAADSAWATLNLSTVLSEQQFARLQRDPARVPVLQAIELTGPATMTVRFRPYTMQ